MKRLALLLLIVIPCFVNAQEEDGDKDSGEHKKVLLGADKDSTRYAVGGLWENWFISAGGGIQTYIGNEKVSSARYNPIMPVFYLELGKWVLPDLTVSLNVSGWTMKGQSRYSKHPYIDFQDCEIIDGHYDYQSFKFYYFIANAQVSLDMMNFILGFTRGMAKKYHVLASFGAGVAFNKAKVVNPLSEDTRNFEYNCSVGVINSYKVSQSFDINGTVRVNFMPATFDFSSYETNVAKYDFIPSITLGATYRLGKSKAKPVKDDEATVEMQGDNVIHDMRSLRNYYGDVATLALRSKTVDVKTYDLLSEPSLINLRDKIDSLKRVNADKNIVKEYERQYELSIRSKKEAESFIRRIKLNNYKYLIMSSVDSSDNEEAANISEQRCRDMYDLLVDVYGVDPDKLILRPVGNIGEYKSADLKFYGIILVIDESRFSVISRYKN